MIVPQKYAKPFENTQITMTSIFNDFFDSTDYSKTYAKLNYTKIGNTLSNHKVYYEFIHDCDFIKNMKIVFLNNTVNGIRNIEFCIHGTQIFKLHDYDFDIIWYLSNSYPACNEIPFSLFMDMLPLILLKESRIQLWIEFNVDCEIELHGIQYQILNKHKKNIFMKKPIEYTAIRPTPLYQTHNNLMIETQIRGVPIMIYFSNLDNNIKNIIMKMGTETIADVSIEQLEMLKKSNDIEVEEVVMFFQDKFNKKELYKNVGLRCFTYEPPEFTFELNENVECKLSGSILCYYKIEIYRGKILI